VTEPNILLGVPAQNLQIVTHRLQTRPQPGPSHRTRLIGLNRSLPGTWAETELAPDRICHSRAELAQAHDTV